MNNRFRILPWLSLAVVMFFGVQWAQAAETGTETAAPTVSIDRTTLDNGGTIKVTGKAPAGKPVYLEIWSADHTVRSNRFDSDKDKETGKCN